MYLRLSEPDVRILAHHRVPRELSALFGMVGAEVRPPAFFARQRAARDQQRDQRGILAGVRIEQAACFPEPRPIAQDAALLPSDALNPEAGGASGTDDRFLSSVSRPGGAGGAACQCRLQMASGASLLATQYWRVDAWPTPPPIPA